MTNYVDNPEIPMGLSMALTKDINALNHFASLIPNKQNEIIEGTHQIHSKQKMHQYVQNLLNP